MSSLYQLTNEFSVIIQDMENLELDPEILKDTIDSLTLPIEEKVENIVKYMKSLEALAEAKKAEAKRLSESAASDLKKVDWFKNYMADNLQKANINKLQAGVFALSFRKGSEVVEVDESKLPEEYWVVEKKPMSKTELKKILKECEMPEIGGKLEIPGVSIVRKPDSLVVK